MAKYPVAEVDELPIGARKIITIDERSIGVFNVNGTFVAVLNLCPHEFAPVCAGRVSGTTEATHPGDVKWVRAGEIIYCPWHGWEFDLLTGDCLTDHRRLRTFPTSIEDGQVYVDLSPGRG